MQLLKSVLAYPETVMKELHVGVLSLLGACLDLGPTTSILMLA